MFAVVGSNAAPVPGWLSLGGLRCPVARVVIALRERLVPVGLCSRRVFPDLLHLGEAQISGEGNIEIHPGLIHTTVLHAVYPLPCV